jgi:periplasmic protein TonB
MNKNDLDFSEDSAEESSFLKRNWLALLVGVAVLAGGTKAAIALSTKGGGVNKKSDPVAMIMLPPPPPVVLPPPPPPQEVEEEMQEVEEEQEETPAEDTGPSTGVVSNGPADAFGMKAKGGAKRVVLGPKSTASTWTPYARSAAGRIADAMRRHNRLKNSTMAITARVWIDSTGRITRATTQSTGDAALDAALREEILNGMQLSGPPPEGMKMPVNLKLSARRPG